VNPQAKIRLDTPTYIDPVLRAGKAFDRLEPENDDQRHGIEIVRKALSWPARQIAINAGEDGSIVVGKILEKDTYAFGFDAESEEYGNLVSKRLQESTCQPAKRLGLMA